MPKVTVWLTSYNHEKFISESIESILGQTYKDYELFIVDDCSTDNSWEIIQSYAEKDIRIKTIRHEYNWGNSGISGMLDKMEGQYVAIAHSDDRWEPTKLEKQVEIIESRNVSACFTLVKVIHDNGQVLEDKEHPYYQIFEQCNRNRYEWLNYFFYNGNCLCHPSILIRRSAYSEYKILPKGLNSYPDFCEWIRLCKHDEIYILQERLTCFRVHSDESNMSGNNINNAKRLSTEEIFILEEFCSLADTEDLVKVFPSAKKYIVHGKIEGRFALAKIMLNVPKNSYRLMGLELLYNLLQDDKCAERVKELYGYTLKDYNTEKQKYDIFHVISDDKYMKCSLYFSKGNGYSEELKVEKEIVIQPKGIFNVRIDLSDFSNGIFLNKMRLDLDEGRYRQFKDIEITCNNQRVLCNMLNGCRKNGWDTFYTMDPQYELDVKGAGCLEIRGQTELLSNSDVEGYFARCFTQYGLLEGRCRELECKLNMIENDWLWKARKKIKKVLGK